MHESRLFSDFQILARFSMSTRRVIVLVLIFLVLVIVSVATAIVIQQRQHQATEGSLYPPAFNADALLAEEKSEEEAESNEEAKTGVKLVLSSVFAQSELEQEQANKLFYLDGEPYPYFVATYRYALDDIQKEFDRHYPKYLEGDADSTYMMSVIARHCISIFPTDPETNSPDIDISETDVRAEFNKLTVASGSSVESLDAIENAHVKVLPTCIKLANVMPEESTRVFDFVHSLVKVSANAGSANAKLEMLDQYIKVDYKNFKESGKLLEGIVRSKEPKAYQHVIDFYGRFRHKEQEGDAYNELVTWRVLRCRVDKNCQQQVMEEVLMSDFGSVIADQIYQHADEIEAKILSGAEVGFTQYRRETEFAEASEKDLPTFVIREEISWQTD